MPEFQYLLQGEPGSHRPIVLRPMALRPNFSVSLPNIHLHYQ